jgi:hypothetical protein
MYFVRVTREGKRNAYKSFVVKSEAKDPLEMCRLIWDCYIKMDLKDVEWEVVNFIRVTQDSDYWWAVVNTIMNFRFP